MIIVPRNRLLFWVAIVVLPFSLLGAVEPAALGIALIAIGSLAALALVDAWLARSGLAGISLTLPELARMSKDRPAKLEIRIRNEREKALTLRVALALPREIQPDQEDTVLALPAGHGWSRFAATVRPLQRGCYSLHTACLETCSPLGFWDARQTVPARAEVRVYPNLAAERKDLAAMFLHRGAFGLHAMRQVGKGREFEKLREYVPGDSFDEIHWKATARRSRPITKVFQVERTQEIYVIIDASRLSARPAPGAVAQATPAPLSGQLPQTAVSASTLERFVTAALVLGLAAEQQGDLFGLLTFANQVKTFVRAKNGKAHYSACREALYTLQPQTVSPDYDEVCSFIRLRLRRRALLLFLTSLDDQLLAESFVRNMDLIRRQHLVLVNMLQPSGVAPLFSNPDLTSEDELYERLGGHLLWQNLRELEKVLQRRGVRFSLLHNERLSAQLVSQYLNIKQRQAL